MVSGKFVKCPEFSWKLNGHPSIHFSMSRDSSEKAHITSFFRLVN